MTESSQEPPDQTGCPSTEVLSCYSLAMLPADHPAARHIAGCPHCREQLETLEAGLTAWENYIRVQCAAIPHERIKAAVRSRLKGSGGAF